MKNLCVLLSALILLSVAPLYASYCSHCGKKQPEAANFCSNCGHAVNNSNMNSCDYAPVCSNNNITTTRSRIVYNDGYNNTSTVRTISTYSPNAETQIIYKNEYYYPVPVTRTVVSESSCDPLLGLMIWGIIHGSHHHHHHRHFAPAPVRHLPPPPRSVSRFSHSGPRRAVFRH